MKGTISMKKLLKTAAIAGGALCLLKGLDNRLEVTHYTISSPNIPNSFSGFKILQISDYHCDNVPGIIEEVRQESPDIIVSTGDLADDDGSYMPAVRLCERLSEIAPIYAVTGNHDLWRGDYNEFENELSRLGVKTLHDERVILSKDESKMSLSGIDDPFTLNNSKAAENIQSSLAKFSRFDGYDILLFHRANLFDLLKYHGFDLVIAGHMHGGHIRLPHGGLVSPRSSWTNGQSIFFPKYFGGHYKAPRTEMIVNRGLGNPTYIPRLFNRPEITVITLKKENS